MPLPNDVDELTAKLAAAGLSAPGLAAPAPPAVLNMPTQTIVSPSIPNGATSSPPTNPVLTQPFLGVSLANPTAPEGVRPPATARALPWEGSLDLGSLRKTPDGGGPAINVDLSQMPGGQHGRIGYQSPPNARGATGAAFNPFAAEQGVLADEHAGNEQLREMRQSDNQFNQEMMGRDVAAARKSEEEARARAVEQAKESKEKEADYQKSLDALGKERIDSNRLWNSKGPADKAMNMIGIALGGFLQGYRGMASNPMLDQLNEEIRRDIDEQRENHAMNAKAVEGKKGLYEMMRQRYGDANAAADAAHAYALDRIAREGAQRAELTKNVQAQADWQQTENQLNMQSAQLKDRAAQLAAAAGAKAPDLKAANELAKRREEAGIPAFESNMQSIQDIIRRNGGELPGTSIPSRLAGHIPYIGDSLRGSDARQLDGAITSVAEAMAHANGQRGTEAIEMNKRIIMGNGSAEDVQAGLARARAVVNARGANIQSGFKPQDVALQQELANAYGGARGGAPPPPPPGFRPAR